MSNQNHIDPPIVATQGNDLLITIGFYRGDLGSGKVRCKLQVVHDGVSIESEEDDKLVFEKALDMKAVPDVTNMWRAEFKAPVEKGGSISLDVEVIALKDGRSLAKAAYRLGPKLNERTAIKRSDRAPRMLHAINTAAGPTAKAVAADSKTKLDDMLEHIHAALIDNDGFRRGIAGSTDGLLSNRRQLSSDELVKVDEQLSLILTEKLLGIPYNMPGNVYGNCNIPDGKKSKLVHLNNDVFWERMRPSTPEITYPWCTECQQLSTMVNYFRGVDIWALFPGAKGELGAQRASLDVPKAAGGIIIPAEQAAGSLDKALYEDAACPLGPGDIFVFSDEKQRYTDAKGVEHVVTAKEAAKLPPEDRAKCKPIPAQDPANHPHINCILRVYKRAGNYFFQLMDTGGQMPAVEGHALFKRSNPIMEGICDGRFITQVRPDGDAAGVSPCVGIGIWPKSYKTDVAKLKKAYERALVARPVGLARLFLFERATGAVLYATPLLRTYTADSHQNFSAARLAWSLRNVPHNAEIGAMWAVWGPRGPLARRLIDSRHTTLFDIRSEFAAATGPSKEFNNAVLANFPYGEMTGFLFLQNILTMSPADAEQAHTGKDAPFRFPTDDKDPEYYKKFVYVEVGKLNNAHKPASWAQDKKWDLNTHRWDQHIFGDRSIRTIKKQVPSLDATSFELKMLEGDMEIDTAQFAKVAGQWIWAFNKGKVVQAPVDAKKDGKVAQATGDAKQSVAITLPQSVVAMAKTDTKIPLYVELALPVIDKRYARPSKFDTYPYFRGDFPLAPSKCPAKSPPTGDACPDFFAADSATPCPSDCPYIVRLRGLTLSGQGKLDKPFAAETLAYSATVSYLDGDALTLRPSASCKATIEIQHAGKTITTSSGVESSPLKLALGSNTIEVVATALNHTKRTYTLTVVRAQPSKDHSLASLSVAPGKLVAASDLSSPFTASTFDYEVVETDAAKLGFTPKPTNSLAKLTINGTAHAAETERTLAMNGFGAHETKIVVTAEDGQASTYTITYRRGDANTKLKTLRVLANYKDQELVRQISLDDEDDADTETYVVEVPNETTRVRVVAVAEANTSRVYLEGKQIWGGGNVNVEGEPALQTNSPTVARLEVVAQNGKRRTYELQIRRPKDAEVGG